RRCGVSHPAARAEDATAGSTAAARRDPAETLDMPRRRTARPATPRGARHGRHGRLGRSEVVRPPLPPLDGRLDRFEVTVGSAVEYLRSSWEELREVSFEIAAMPSHDRDDGIPRWRVDHAARRVALFRVPIERL